MSKVYRVWISGWIWKSHIWLAAETVKDMQKTPKFSVLRKCLFHRWCKLSAFICKDLEAELNLLLEDFMMIWIMADLIMTWVLADLMIYMWADLIMILVFADAILICVKCILSCLPVNSMRPWDPINDVIQYEKDFIIQTQTHHRTPVVRTRSITSLEQKKESRVFPKSADRIRPSHIQKIQRAPSKHLPNIGDESESSAAEAEPRHDSDSSGSAGKGR